MFCSNCGFPLESQTAHCPLCETKSDVNWRNAFRSALPQGTPLHNESYRVGRMLVQGDFTLTYLGCAPASNRLVVIKEFFPGQSSREGESVVPPPALGAQAFETGRDQFLEEAHTQAEFQCPEIASVDRFFEANHSAYVVTKYFPWPTLREKLTEGTQFSEIEAIRLVSGVGRAVQLLHEKHILHLDLKPENIVLAEPDRIVLPDFGLDKKLNATIEHGRWNFEACPPPGTEGYAAPEQKRCDSDNVLSEATDVYGLGALLYETLTGTVPTDAQMRERGHDLLPSVRQLQPSLHEATEHAVMAALELKQSARPQTVAEFLNLLAIVPDPATETEIASDESQDVEEDSPAPAAKKSLLPQLRIPPNVLNVIEVVCGFTLVSLILTLVWMRIDAARRLLAGETPIVEAKKPAPSGSLEDLSTFKPKSANAVLPVPTAKPSRFNSIGTWQGTYDAMPATLVITEHQGVMSTGVLTLARRNGIFQVAVSFKDIENSTRISAQETKTLYAPPGTSWSRVGFSGSISADSSKISGPGYKLGRIPAWSFSKVSPTAQVPLISDDAETPVNHIKGRWQGRFDSDSVALNVNKHQGDYFEGLITSGSAGSAAEKVAVVGYIAPATSSIVMTETKILNTGTGVIGSLGQEVGKLSNQNLNQGDGTMSMSGTRTDSRSKQYSWSFKRSGAL